MKGRLNKKVPLYTTIFPVTFWLILLVAIPLIYVLVLSFLTRLPNGRVDFVFTMANYKKLINPDYFHIYGISLFVSAVTTAICIVLSYPFAWFIAQGSERKKTLMMLLVIIPFWTNSLIRLYGWKTILGNEGVLNKVLLTLHLINEPIQMLYSLPAVILGMVYTLLPFMILPIYASVEKLDKTLLEAANDLGAKSIQSFLQISLPLTSPGIFAGSIMVFIPTLGYFFVSDLLGGGNTMMVGNLIKNQFYTAQNWPLGAALSIVLIIMTLLLVRIYTLMGGKLDDLGVAK
ncbi:MAG: ABC transporter permease [Spirochaetales bacterium]|nr:ABC transporter permease [Spirochaetales bacterium]